MRFRGELPSAKSLFIRALIAGSYSAPIDVIGNSDSEDIEHVRTGLEAMKAGDIIECGDGGAPLRFLALRASRIPGEHALTGSTRLFARPQGELVAVLSQLGVGADLGDRRLTVRGDGWPAEPTEVAVDCSRSTQFASAVLLNAWELAAPLTIVTTNLERSRGYWEMTAELVRSLGMEVEATESGASVPPGQVVAARRYHVELDMGCAFAVAAVAAVSGEAILEGFPVQSLQPDARFPELLEQMGARVERTGSALTVRESSLSGIEVDLGGSPDLFPVLGALAGVAEGASELSGAAHLRFKESDRITKVAQLAAALGREVEVTEGGVRIGGARRAMAPFTFDADHDHRMAMAAAVAHHAGAPITLTGGEAVAKSFAGFWDVVGWHP